MTKRMLIDASHPEETRVVVLDGNRLEAFDIESANKMPLKGNIYLARVVRVEPSLQAAFVEYGGNRHGFLAFSEIHPDYYQLPVADRQRLIEMQQAEAREEQEREDAEEAARDGDEALTGALQAAIEGEAEAIGEAPGEDGAAEDDRREDDRREDEGREAAEPAPEANGSDDSDSERDSGSAIPMAIQVERITASDEPEAATPAESEAAAEDAALAAERQENAEAAGDQRSTEDNGAEDEGADDNGAEDESRDENGTEGSNGEPTTGEPGSERRQARGRQDRGGRGRGRDRGRGGDRGGERSRDDRSREDEVESVGNSEAPPPESLGGTTEDDARERRIPPRFLRHYKIQEVIKRRQIMLIQVVKEERGGKGAALTTYISLAGRFSVLMPNSPRGGGVSRKITSTGDRKRLREIIDEQQLPQGMSLIVRTAGAQRPKPEIKRDCEYLLRLWDNIRERTFASTAPALIYEEADLIKRSIRDVFGKDVEEVHVEGDEAYQDAREFMRMLMPAHVNKVKPVRDGVPLFARHGVDVQLDAMHSPNVQLKSGGYIVINQTEALVSIDVNSGRATRDRHIEDTALRTNLEAADEVARQLRLRDLAGLIVIDFIDMESARNDAQVERRLKEALKQDRARIQVGRISHFGLLEMSRQRLRPSVVEHAYVACPHCQGRGLVRSVESSGLQVLRQIEEEGARRRAAEIIVHCAMPVMLWLLNQKRERLGQIEQRFGMRVLVQPDDTLIPPALRIEKTRAANPDALPERQSALRMDFAPEPEPIDDEPEVEEIIAEPQARVAAEHTAEPRERNTAEPRERNTAEPRERNTAEPRERNTAEPRERNTAEPRERASAEPRERAEIPGEKPAEGAEGEAGRRRRRRRRRGGRREGVEGQSEAGSAEEDETEEGEETAEAQPAQQPDAAVATEATSESKPDAPAEAAEESEEDEAARRRRRGRRGGRRRREEGEQPAEPAPTLASPTPPQAPPPARRAPTPADPFAGHMDDIFMAMEAAEEAAERAVKSRRSAPQAAQPVPAVPEVAVEQPVAVTPAADLPLPEIPVAQAPMAELPVAELPAAELPAAVVPEPVTIAAAPVMAEPVAPADSALAESPAAAVPVPAPELAAVTAPAEPVAAPPVAPIVLGEGAVPELPRKRGWWRA